MLDRIGELGILVLADVLINVYPRDLAIRTWCIRDFVYRCVAGAGSN